MMELQNDNFNLKASESLPGFSYNIWIRLRFTKEKQKPGIRYYHGVIQIQNNQKAHPIMNMVEQPNAHDLG